MPELQINIAGAGGGYADRLRGRDVMNTDVILVETLDDGMQSGKPSVAFICLVGADRAVIAQTSLRLFQMACAATIGRYGNVTGDAVLAKLQEGVGTLHVSEIQNCPKCRAELPGICKFCYECGEKL